MTKLFPQNEMFGITSQIRKACVSVAANIAEGHGREQTGSFIQFLRIAQGSLKELETHFIIAQRVGLIEEPEVVRIFGQCEQVGRMLRSLIRTLQDKI